MNTFFRLFVAPLLLCFSLVGLNACAYNANTKTASFSTAALKLDVAAAQVALGNIEAIPTVKAYLATHAKDKTKFDGFVAGVSKISDQIATTTGGSVSLDVGKNWAQALTSEFQSALNIASPLVGDFAPEYQKYITTAQSLVPVISALISTFGVEAPAHSTGAVLIQDPSTIQTPADIRDALIKGPTH